MSSGKWDIFIDPGSVNGCVPLIGRLERSAEVKVFAESLPSEALQGPSYYSDTNASNYVISLLYVHQSCQPANILPNEQLMINFLNLRFLISVFCVCNAMTCSPEFINFPNI